MEHADGQMDVGTHRLRFVDLLGHTNLFRQMIKQKKLVSSILRLNILQIANLLLLLLCKL